MLLAATLAAFLPVAGNGFFLLDDADYLTGNAVVAGGLTWEGVRWAFTTRHAGNWHPLTWISHMLDVTLFGLEPAGHHLSSLALHALAALLLFLLLRELTGSRWTSLATSLLFAVHPLRVESVAWAAERKDLLAGCLCLAAILAWTHHLRRPSGGRLAGVAALHALALLAKPTAVVLPLCLVALDWWPLGRLGPGRRWSSLLGPVLEKWPFALLSLAAAAVTLAVQGGAGAVIPLETLPPGPRLGNAAVSVWRYLGSFLAPADLSYFYPFPAAGHPGWAVAAAAGGLAAAVPLLFLLRRRYPFLAAGWFWYLGGLLPVLGLVQAGVQARADRYTYLPLIGVALALAAAARPLPPAARWSGLCLAAVLLGTATWRQTGYWRDPQAMLTRALGLDPANWLAHLHQGNHLLARGDMEGAVRHHRLSDRLRPGRSETKALLGHSLARQGSLAEARLRLGEALAIRPGRADALADLAVVESLLAAHRREEDAARALLRADGDDPAAGATLARALLRQGRWGEADEAYARLIARHGARPAWEEGLRTARLRAAEAAP
jgi:tetratricopeptide (TPR) repeat protein